MSDQPVPLTPEQAERRQEMYQRWADWRDEMHQGVGRATPGRR